MEFLQNYHNQYILVLSFSAILLSFLFVLPRFGGWGAATLLYFTFSALWVWVMLKNRYWTIEPYNQMALRYFAADSIGKLLIILMPAMLFAEKLYARYVIEFAAFVFIVLNLLSVFGEALFYGCVARNTCGGFVGNPSISLGLTVCLLPLALRCVRPGMHTVALIWLTFLGCLLGKATIPAVLFAMFLVGRYMLTWPNDKLKERLMVIGPMLLIVFIPFYGFVGFDWIDSSGRFIIWEKMMQAWARPDNLVKGMGFGTYHVFSINLQKAMSLATNGHWNWLHNEFLQVLFETGIIGLLLFGALFTESVKRAFKKGAAEVLSVIMFGAYMVVNPALHSPWPAVFAAYIFAYVLYRKPLQKGFSH